MEKLLVIIVICLFVFTSFDISASELTNNENIRKEDQTNASIIYYTQNDIITQETTINTEVGRKLIDIIKNNTIGNSNNSKLIDILKEFNCIPNSISINKIMTLFTIPKHYKQLPHKNHFSGSGTSYLCSIISSGSGKISPFFLLPRPRIILHWTGYQENDPAITTVGGLISNNGFLAKGDQNGMAIGFIGIGVTYGTPLGTAYALAGYSLYTRISSDDIDFYPPNNIPNISNITPFDNQKNVSLSLSELSFSITDEDNDFMSYSVTTNPDIGTGSGKFKRNGTYSIPISGLQSSKTYTWIINISDGKDTIIKSYNFTTVFESPIITNPLPKNGTNTVYANISQLSFSIADPQGDLMEVTVETLPHIGNFFFSDITNGTYSIPINGLDYDTSYTWYVNATDGIHWKKEKYVFTTLPENILIFYPSNDADIFEKSPNYNSGSDKYLNFRSFQSGWNYQIFIKFDLSTIRLDMAIKYAKLKIYYVNWVDNNPGGDAMYLYRVLQDWNENTITWNNQPSTTYESSSQCILSESPNNWIIWDITDDVNKFISEEVQNYGWFLKDETSWNGSNIPLGRFYSKEYGDYTPYIEIGIDTSN